MPEFTSRSDIYGSATLDTRVPNDITYVYAETGCTAMPLGHNPGDRNTGAAFNVGPEAKSKGHALTFGRTRGGKGVSSIIPALLTYKGSMVVIDPKGENAWTTAERRRQLGQRVVILDPWNEVNFRYGSKAGITQQITHFNPLSALDPNDEDFADDVTAIAEAFILQTGNDPHWTDSARELVAGLIAAEVQENPGRASMKSVRKLLRAPMSVLRDAVSYIVETHSDSLAAGKLAAFVEKEEGINATNDKEISSIRSTARTQTAFLDSAALISSMETDNPPFNLSELATGKVTLYLVLPVKRLRSHGRWLRTILTLAISAIADQPEPPELPVTLLLDELGTISPGSGLSMIEQSYGLMAGLGIRIWAFLQDLPQLKRDYPHSWETFISNSSVIQLLNVADSTTATYFSNYIGTATVNAKTGGYSNKQKPYAPGDSFDRRVLERLSANYMSGGDEKDQEKAWARAKTVHFAGGKYRQDPDGSRLFHDGTRIAKTSWTLHDDVVKTLHEQGISETGYTEWGPDEQLAARPVIFPWEIVDAAPDTSILIVPGRYNAQLHRYVYYSDPVFAKWARPDPRFGPFIIKEPPPAAVREAVYVPPSPPAPVPVSTPANDNYSRAPQTVGDELADLSKKAAQQAAGAAVNFLKDRLKRP